MRVRDVRAHRGPIEVWSEDNDTMMRFDAELAAAGVLEPVELQQQPGAVPRIEDFEEMSSDPRDAAEGWSR
jgi:hypothetical protein